MQQAVRLDAAGYYEGYGRYAQDVVIPAFLAAYGKKDPNTLHCLITTTRISAPILLRVLLPMPNWTVTYNGFQK